MERQEKTPEKLLKLVDITSEDKKATYRVRESNIFYNRIRDPIPSITPQKKYFDEQDATKNRGILTSTANASNQFESEVDSDDPRENNSVSNFDSIIDNDNNLVNREPEDLTVSSFNKKLNKRDADSSIHSDSVDANIDIALLIKDNRRYLEKSQRKSAKLINDRYLVVFNELNSLVQGLRGQSNTHLRILSSLVSLTSQDILNQNNQVPFDKQKNKEIKQSYSLSLPEKNTDREIKFEPTKSDIFGAVEQIKETYLECSNWLREAKSQKLISEENIDILFGLFQPALADQLQAEFFKLFEPCSTSELIGKARKFYLTISTSYIPISQDHSGFSEAMWLLKLLTFNSFWGDLKETTPLDINKLIVLEAIGVFARRMLIYFDP